MNVILAVKQHAGAQREELLAERVQLLRRIREIGGDLAILDVYDLMAGEQTPPEAPDDPRQPADAGKGKDR